MKIARMERSILTADVLAKYVIRGEETQFRSLNLLKITALDPIYYYPGISNHSTIADFFGMPHVLIGFAGRVSGILEKDARLYRGGSSLSEEFRRSIPEEDRAFELIEAMMVQLGGELKWST